jgi:hypothetical protein
MIPFLNFGRDAFTTTVPLAGPSRITRAELGGSLTKLEPFHRSMSKLAVVVPDSRTGRSENHVTVLFVPDIRTR